MKTTVTYENIKKKAVKMDKKLASNYFKKGADLGAMNCALRYANMNYKSDGIPYNFEESLKYCKILAYYGDKEGTYKYAKILLDKNSSVFNVEKGMKYLDKAFRVKSKDAAFLYGLILYNGDYGFNVDKVYFYSFK